MIVWMCVCEKDFYSDDCSLSGWHIENLKLGLGGKTDSNWYCDKIYVDSDDALSHNRNWCDNSQEAFEGIKLSFVSCWLRPMK